MAALAWRSLPALQSRAMTQSVLDRKASGVGMVKDRYREASVEWVQTARAVRLEIQKRAAKFHLQPFARPKNPAARPGPCARIIAYARTP